MSEPSFHLACDLGAESGRLILGRLQDGRLHLEEVHRFLNGAVPLLGSLRWNILGIFAELTTGLRKAAEKQPAIRGMSVDSWGVDYALFNARQPLLAPPHCYRDSRADRFLQETLADGSQMELIFRETGIQFLFFNTLYQLRAEVAGDPEILRSADAFLNIADYLNYLFCGVPRAEESLASTTQLYDPGHRCWSHELIKTFHLPEEIFPTVVPSGTKLGHLRSDIAEAAGLSGSLEVIATCSHDTAAAIAAVPANSGADDWAYLISGTWSLLGVELPAPLLTPEVRAANFTNEVGFGGSIRFLKNIAGLWILQEARRDWLRQGKEYAYADLVALAGQAEAFTALIHPNAARFGKPGSMLDKIRAYCRETGQPAPEGPAQTVRCILESLALLYAQTVAQIESLTARAIRVLHIVGGGSQNGLLNQFTADATGRMVLVGPTEATAIGNLLIQAIALGEIGSLAELREIVARSFPTVTVSPQSPDAWHRAAERFAQLQLLD